MFGLFKRGGNAPEERKRRSEDLLRKRGIAVAEHLPVVADENAVLRPARHVFDRIVALWEVVNNALEAADADKEGSVDFLQDIGAWAMLTPVEQRFLRGEQLPEQDVIDLGWKTEEIKALYWVLGELDDLGLPDTEAEDEIMAISERVTERTDDLENARRVTRMRKPVEVLDALDLHYRLHWAAREHRRGTTGVPSTYSSSIVREWHAALLWVASPTVKREDVNADT